MLRNLWRRPVRTALTMLGIAIGVAAVVSLGAMAEGFVTNYNTAVGLESDILVSQANAYDVLFSIVDETFKERIQAVRTSKRWSPASIPGSQRRDALLLVFGYEPGSAALRHYASSMASQ